jgi:hypothetical protein
MNCESYEPHDVTITLAEAIEFRTENKRLSKNLPNVDYERVLPTQPYLIFRRSDTNSATNLGPCTMRS